MVSRSRTVTQRGRPPSPRPPRSQVHGDAVGGADLVLAAVPLADGAGLVIVHHKVLGQHLLDLLGGGASFLDRGSTAHLKGARRGWRRSTVRTSSLPFLSCHHFLVVGVHQEGQGHAVGAQGGLDDIGDIVLVLLLVEVW